MDIRELSDSLHKEMAHLWALTDAAIGLTYAQTWASGNEVVSNLEQASRFVATAAGLIEPPPGGVKEPGSPANPLDPLGLADGVRRDVKRLRWPLRRA